MRRLVLLSAAALVATPVLAADQVGQWYFTPQVGGIAPDNDRSLLEDKDWLYGLSFGKHFSPAWSGEISFNDSQQFDNGPGGTQFRALSADLLRVFNRGGRFSPYLTVGTGVLQNQPAVTGPKTNDFMAQAGVGAFVKLWESDTGSFSLRPELKARWDDAGAPGYLHDYIGMLGFQFSFGPPPPPPPAPPPAPPPVAVAPPPPPPPPPPPADSDNDGVLDDADRCPGTPAGTLVDANGCPQRGSITLQGVTFEFNSDQLTADSRPILARVAGDLKKFPRLRVEMQGHTDSVGADAYNLGLSQRRADSVRMFLLGEGVPAERVTAKGYGETQPIADNKTADGRASNRRVVMSVVDNPGEVRVQGEGVAR